MNTQAEEPFRRTLARNVAIAVSVSAMFALVRHDAKGFLPVLVLALWPSLGGHYVDMASGNGVRARVSAGPFARAVARMLIWFAGGVLLYLCMSANSRVLPIKVLPLNLWWFGGLLFIGIELVVHAIMAIRGVPSFYNRRG